MVRSIVRAHHWTPTEIENLYLDDRDFQSIGYWYNDVMAVENSINDE